jgi:hypothetical protein
MCMHAECNIGMTQNEYVNIRIQKDTWKRMQPHKDEPGKTWDDVLNELLDEIDDSGDAVGMTPETADW